MHQTFFRTLCLYETGRRALCELSVSVQLESTRKRERRKKNVLKQIYKIAGKTLQRKNAKTWSALVLSCNSLSECNWTESFWNLSEKRQAPIWIISQTKQLSANHCRNERLNKKKLVYISMHFYKVFFLDILPFSTSEISFCFCWCCFRHLQLQAKRVNQDLCLEVGSMHAGK